MWSPGIDRCSYVYVESIYFIIIQSKEHPFISSGVAWPWEGFRDSPRSLALLIGYSGSMSCGSADLLYDGSKIEARLRHWRVLNISGQDGTICLLDGESSRPSSTKAQQMATSGLCMVSSALYNKPSLWDPTPKPGHRWRINSIDSQAAYGAILQYFKQ